MHNIIVADIFGKTKALDNLASKLPGLTEILDPYLGDLMAFTNENDAYAYFSKHITLMQYSDSVLKKIQSIEVPVNLIGFSVGASAIWNLSSNFKVNNVVNAYCYYGSQIRNNLHIEPSFPIELIFPAKEQHFSVTELISRLKGKANLTIRQVNYLHGFMNPHSLNYNQHGYDKEFTALCEHFNVSI